VEQKSDHQTSLVHFSQRHHSSCLAIRASIDIVAVSTLPTRKGL
jgi:hypothetical protein